MRLFLERGQQGGEFAQYGFVAGDVGGRVQDQGDGEDEFVAVVVRGGEGDGEEEEEKGRGGGC